MQDTFRLGNVSDDKMLYSFVIVGYGALMFTII